MSAAALTVTYTSPTNAPFTHTTALPAAEADKTAFLIALRAAVGTTQEHVNRELTERMEEDKRREADKGVVAKVDDVREEENYGEEVVEEED